MTDCFTRCLHLYSAVYRYLCQPAERVVCVVFSCTLLLNKLLCRFGTTERECRAAALQDEAAATHSAIRWVEAGESSRDAPRGESIARLSGRKAMDPLTEAISSALYSKQAEQQARPCLIRSQTLYHVSSSWSLHSKSVHNHFSGVPGT